MQTLIHADIFFFVATIGFVIIGIAIVIGLIFVTLILKNLHKLSEIVKNEADMIAGDIDAMRAKSKSLTWSIAFKLFRNFFMNSRHNKQRD